MTEEKKTGTIKYRPIGIIHTPFKTPKGTPIQPKKAGNIGGSVELFEEYKIGLSDLDDFSHLILIYHMHLVNGFSLKVIPFLDTVLRGLFSTRSPWRPNPIGISVVKLEKIEGRLLFVSELDMVDGTPLLDIKPYVPNFDEKNDYRIGWLTGKAHLAKDKTADNRINRNNESDYEN
jgi:tRNA-Thr(GGU) m(6)t(6)A37 methyltransferase TsaA